MIAIDDFKLIKAFMHDNFIKDVRKLLGKELPLEYTNAIYELLHPKKLRKHQLFMDKDEVCTQLAFVAAGALKSYTIDNRGKEEVISLYLENEWVGDLYSFENQMPSDMYIEAVESCELLTINKEGFEHLIGMPIFARMYREFLEKSTYKLQREVQMVKTFSAAEKIEYMQRTRPEFLLRFPQQTLASYLGMSKETFSRVRNNAASRRPS